MRQDAISTSTSSIFPDVPAIWVVDSTPLIVLAKISYLRLLTQFSGQLIISQAVADEVLAADENDPARQALEVGFGQQASNSLVPSQVAVIGLGAGEESVLTIALEYPGSRAVLDDGKARAAAQALVVPTIGTLGIIARAKAEGYIPAAKTLIQALQSVQFWADDALIRTVLQRLGETWP